MGIHWASKGTVVQRLHQITKHRVFTGPAFQVGLFVCLWEGRGWVGGGAVQLLAFGGGGGGGGGGRRPAQQVGVADQAAGAWRRCTPARVRNHPLLRHFPSPIVAHNPPPPGGLQAAQPPSAALPTLPLSPPPHQVARELSEAAQGGQVLLSHEGWVRLRQDMATAGFPVVEQLGLYKVESWPAPVWVYQASTAVHVGRYKGGGSWGSARCGRLWAPCPHCQPASCFACCGVREQLVMHAAPCNRPILSRPSTACLPAGHAAAGAPAAPPAPAHLLPGGVGGGVGHEHQPAADAAGAQGPPGVCGMQAG